MSTEAHDVVDVSPYCPAFQHTVELIGRRWTGAIIRSLLAERLRELEAEGIITRTVYPEHPVRIEYRLTEKGRELERIVAAIDAWTARWIDPAAHGIGPGDPAG